MALITLKNGKTVDMDLWYYMNMSDDELQDLEAMNIGFEAENPFHSSALFNSKAYEQEEPLEEDVPENDFDDKELLDRDDC